MKQIQVPEEEKAKALLEAFSDYTENDGWFTRKQAVQALGRTVCHSYDVKMLKNMVKAGLLERGSFMTRTKIKAERYRVINRNGNK